MLHIHNVSLALEGQTILAGVTFDLAEGEIVCLLGPSGSGKTSLLRVVAGLEEGYEGDVRWRGLPQRGRPAAERGFGLMFQDFALFPHLTVLENVAFPLKMRGVSMADRQHRARAALAQVSLAGRESRSVGQLSGGEKQRVALARSLVYAPPLLMLDEPLGSLDAALRLELGREIRDAVRRQGMTALYVTHDQSEAFGIADRVVLMNAGRIEQIAPPRELYFAPRSRFVCHFLGLNNIVPDSTGAGWVCLHPTGLSFDQAGDEVAQVAAVRFEGDTTRVRVCWREHVLEWCVSSRQPVPSEGSTARIRIAPEWALPVE